MGDDGDRRGWSGERWMTLVGAVIGLIFVFAAGVVVLAVVSAPGATDAPNAEWDIVRLDGPYVRIVHAGGEPVETGNLIVVVDGVKRPVEWDQPVLDDGDSGRVQAAEGEQLQLYWLDHRGDRVLLSTWVV